MYQDKSITCRDCGEEFVFTAGNKSSTRQRGWNEPTRCKDCRGRRKAERGGQGGGSARPRREMYSVTCADCGQETQVPFQPSQDRPVYCRECFNRRRNF